MGLSTVTNKLATQTVSASFDQLLYLDSADGLVEATLKIVSTDAGHSAIQIDDERLLVQGADTSNAAAFEVKNTGGTSVFKVNASTPSVLVSGSGVKLYFSDAGGEYISGNGSVLSIVGGSEIDLTATAIDINGNVDISGTLTISVDDTGTDVRVYSATASEGLFYDASEDEFGLLLTTKLKFHDIGGGEEIYASGNGVLLMNSGTSLTITTPTLDLTSSTKVDFDSPILDMATQGTTIELKQQVDALAFDGDSDNILNIDASNNRVGIGTAAPVRLLDIEGTAGSDAHIRIGTADPDQDAILEFWTGEASYGKNAIVCEGIDSYRRANMHFVVDASGDTNSYAIPGDIAMTIAALTRSVGIGTTDPLAQLHVEGATDGTGVIMTTAHGSSASGDYPVLRLMRSKGTTGSPSIVADNDYLGTIDFLGYIGSSGDSYTNYQRGARILSRADGTPSNATGDMPGDISFWTCPEGSDLIQERMTIRTDGKVGIGTTIPGAVHGTTPGGDGQLHIYRKATTGSVVLPCLHLEVSNEGGVNTDTGEGPGINFYVSDDSPDSNYAGADESHLAGQIATVRSNSDLNSGRGDMTFSTGDNGATLVEAMRITYDSNVGIGTDAPEANLHITSASAGTWAPYADADEFVIEHNGDGGMQIATPDANAKIIAFSSPETTGSYDAIIQAYDENHANTNAAQLIHGTKNASTTIACKAGNVGLGMVHPYNRLSVSPLQYSTGTASQSGTTVTGSGTTFTAAMIGSQFIYIDGTSSGAITAFTSTTEIEVTTSQTVSSQNYKIHYQGLQVTSAGYVGIGLNNPTHELQIVAGDSDSHRALYITSATTAADANDILVDLDYTSDADLDGAMFIQFQDSDGNIGEISGNLNTTTFATSSDYRRKTDFKDIADATGTINQLKLYDFAWKKNTSKRAVGVIAHEAQEIFPEAVTGEKDAMTTKEYTDENGELQTKDVIKAQCVDYSKFVPLLLKSIQELTAKVEALENNNE